jgi:hypothetical protein
VLIFYAFLFGVVYLALCDFGMDQKQQRVNVCEDPRQIASDDALFLPRVMTGDESWIYGYDPETKQQSSQCKNPDSQRLKKAKQMKSKVK